jgi:DNA-binding NtrC family response regulator
MLRVLNALPDNEACVYPGRVLLVDDQPELRRLFRRSLVRAGHEVIEAVNGRVALRLMPDGNFDVVISDVRMPDMSGVELLQAIRLHDPDLPVLLVSGSPDLETAKQAAAYGAAEYLLKPVALDKLRVCAEKAIELRRARLAERQAAEGFEPDASGTFLKSPPKHDL